MMKYARLDIERRLTILSKLQINIADITLENVRILRATTLYV